VEALLQTDFDEVDELHDSVVELLVEQLVELLVEQLEDGRRRWSRSTPAHRTRPGMASPMLDTSSST
jgi:hypothetical protein